MIDLNKKAGVEKLAQEIEREVKEKMRQIAVEAFRAVVTATPVDTGRLRFGWYITVGEPSSETPPEGKYSFPAIADHSRIDENFSLDSTIWITNNVPYIVAVNDGTSRQQPRRFVEAAIERISNIAERI